MALICTIHQPSPILFDYFDRLLLLGRGGKTIYFGDIGKQSQTLISYFTKHGARSCDATENPAEYILEVIGAGVSGKASSDWPAIWKASSEYQSMQSELENLNTKGGDNMQDLHPREFATSLGYQFIEVYKRLNLVWWRSPFYNIGRLVNGLMIGLVLGFTFWNLNSSSSDLRSRVFILFQSMLVGILLIFATIPVMYTQREYFRRDYASKLYSWIPFGFAIVLVEIPYLLLTATTSFFCLYWTAGLHKQSTPLAGFYLWLMMCTFTCYVVALGQSIAALSIILFQALIIVSLLFPFLFLFCGVLIPPSTLPTFWRSWVYHMMPTRYYLEGVVTNVLEKVEITCTSDDYVSFTPPKNLTCGAYVAPFLANATGYIVNPNATAPEQCDLCLFSTGPDYYGTLGWDASNKWRNFGILLLYWVAATIATLIFVYFNRKPKR
jgi:ABC-type multidrug transport system permease subunit